jgi:uncharacterized protein (TIGR02246 family)
MPVSRSDTETVAAAIQAWADAFNSHNLERILALYDAEAVFWGTVSPTLRDTPAAIREYFQGLPDRLQARVELEEQRLRIYDAMALNTGSYTFSDVRDGQRITIPARFSFTYRQREGRWLIVDHHSSAVPSP